MHTREALDFGGLHKIMNCTFTLNNAKKHFPMLSGDTEM